MLPYNQFICLQYPHSISICMCICKCLWTVCCCSPHIAAIIKGCSVRLVSPILIFWHHCFINWFKGILWTACSQIIGCHRMLISWFHYLVTLVSVRSDCLYACEPELFSFTFDNVVIMFYDHWWGFSYTMAHWIPFLNLSGTTWHCSESICFLDLSKLACTSEFSVLAEANIHLRLRICIEKEKNNWDFIGTTLKVDIFFKRHIFFILFF